MKKMNKKGYEGEFKNILFAFILMSLFGMLILTAVVQVGNNYEMDTSEVVGGSLALSKFNESITNIESQSQSMMASFNKGTIWSSVAGVVVEGVFGLSKTMFVLIISPFAIIVSILQDNFGVPVYVTSVLIGILAITIIFAVWRWIKIGE